MLPQTWAGLHAEEKGGKTVNAEGTPPRDGAGEAERFHSQANSRLWMLLQTDSEKHLITAQLHSSSAVSQTMLTR